MEHSTPHESAVQAFERRLRISNSAIGMAFRQLRAHMKIASTHEPLDHPTDPQQDGTLKEPARRAGQ